jgi:hypothetical protein
MIKTLLFSLILVACSLHVFPQDESSNSSEQVSNDGKGWVFGLNFGVYYTSRKTAGYYNGNLNNENNVGYVMNNYYWYQDIFHAMGAHDTVQVYGLPQDMHYKLSMQPGIYMQYCFSPTLALLIEFNYMKLKSEDVIVFEVDPPQDYLANPDLRLYPIHGAEERIYADIGIKRTIPKSKKFSYYYMGGVNVNSTQVKKSSFYVENVEYSMINNIDGSYVPGGNYQTYNVYQGGIGLGIFGGAGTTLTFANRMVAELGLTSHLVMVNLTGYESMNPGIGANVRFIF